MSPAEHELLRDAALAGDVDGAVALLEDHLRGTLDSVRAALAAREASPHQPTRIPTR